MGTNNTRTKKQRTKKKIIVFGIEIVLLLALLAGVYIVQKLNKIDRPDTTSKDEDIEINDLDKEAIEILKGYTNIAIFGLDNRTNGSWSAGNSDVIMIASINNDTKEVKLVSVYRDTYLDVGDGVFRKINSAYGKGGAENAVNALNASLDLDITDYVVVDFAAVTEVVDLLGGVEITVQQVEVNQLNKYGQEVADIIGTTFHTISGAGTYILDGTQATGYARIRKTAGDDYRRTERQRTVVEQMVKEVKKSDLATINGIIDTMCSKIYTSMSNATLLSLAASVFDYELADTHGFPFELSNKKMGGSIGDVVAATDLVTNVSELHEYLFGVKNYVPSSKVQGYSRQIINDTGLTKNDTMRFDNPLDTEDATETEVSEGTSAN